tara:strand:+ start:8418 stop:9512 length:1095 start_codon:yes stop_codon:yes gene_type:complete
MADENQEAEADPFAGFVDHTGSSSNNQSDAEVNTAGEADDQHAEAPQNEINNIDDTTGDESFDASSEGDDGDDDGNDDAALDADGDDEGDRSSDENGGDGEEESSGDAEDPKPKRKLSPQQRINQIRRKAGDADRRADAAEARAVAAEERISALEKGLTPDAEAAKDKEEATSNGLVKPDVTDAEKYPYGELDSNYQADMVDYRVDTKLAERDQKSETTKQEASAQVEAQQWATKYEDTIDKGIEAYEDFDEVVVQAADRKEYALTPETAMMGLDSPVGEHVIYAIASDKELASKIAKMSVVNQGREFGRLEARFTDKPKHQENNIIPNTAPPASRRRGNSGNGKFDAEHASFEDFEKEMSRSN